MIEIWPDTPPLNALAQDVVRFRLVLWGRGREESRAGLAEPSGPPKSASSSSLEALPFLARCSFGKHGRSRPPDAQRVRVGQNSMRLRKMWAMLANVWSEFGQIRAIRGRLARNRAISGEVGRCWGQVSDKFG